MIAKNFTHLKNEFVSIIVTQISKDWFCFGHLTLSFQLKYFKSDWEFTFFKCQTFIKALKIGEGEESK